MILAGDIGGTKTVIGLFDATAEGLLKRRDVTYASQQHRSLQPILGSFLQGERAMPIEAACFGVAGPVIEGKSSITNLPWELDEQAIADAIGAPCVKLLNDLEAAAYGMLHLGPDQFSVLNEGVQRSGNIAVIAAGTGLGEAMLIWDGQLHHPVASEGGHADFAARNTQEVALLEFLKHKYGTHVSYERVLSGPGLFDIYCFLRETSGKPEPDWLTDRLNCADPSAIVTDVGLTKDDPVCTQAVEAFVSIYGAEAGNLALKCLALGGVLIGGGIAPKMLPAFATSRFISAFVEKGRYAEFMGRMPVKVALSPGAPLIGAAHFALRLCT